MRDGISRRAQAVAIKCRAHQGAIKKGHSCRAVPGLHQAGMVMVKSLNIGRDFHRTLPGFRDHHQERVMHRTPRAGKQFEDIIKTCGVAARGLNHGLEPFGFIAPDGMVQNGFAGPHPVTVP